MIKLTIGQLVFFQTFQKFMRKLFLINFMNILIISKAETVKTTLLQTDNFFQSSDKKATCLTRTQRKILGIPRNRELNWAFLSISSERKFFTLQNSIDSF